MVLLQLQAIPVKVCSAGHCLKEFDSLLDWSREIHASTLILSRVGIPLLRFHLHPSHRRSVGQTIGLTAYSPQRAAIFTMPLLTRACPAYFRLGALFEPLDISTTSEPTVPFGIVSFGPADPVSARHLGCKGSLTPRPEVGSLRSPHYGHGIRVFGG